MGERGRPPTGERVQLRIPGPLLAKLDKRAKKEGVNRAEMVRRLLDEVL